VLVVHQFSAGLRPNALGTVSPTRPEAYGQDHSSSLSCFPLPIEVSLRNIQSTLESRGAANNVNDGTVPQMGIPSQLLVRGCIVRVSSLTHLVNIVMSYFWECVLLFYREEKSDFMCGPSLASCGV